MCTAFCEFILGGCVVGTSYQCAAAIESALVCASLPFGDLKWDISATNVCEWSGLWGSFDSTCSLCGVPMGAKCSPSILMHIGHLASTIMAKQGQEGGVTCITYLSNIVKTMFYNVSRILFVSDGQLFFSGIKLHNYKEVWCRSCLVWACCSGVLHHVCACH